MNRANITLLCILFVLVCFFGCETLEREYNDDIVYELENGSDVIIIKEWSFLLGSGAEIYYKAGDEKPVLLGQTTGGDDGFCPFKEGMYEITQDSRSVTVKWCFNPPSDWRRTTFELPE